jgi:hypothetical protein
MDEDQDEIHRVLVSLAIEKALLDVGKLIHDDVIYTLKERYHCSLEDCYDHPQYLHNVLGNLDEAGNIIIVSLKKDLDKFRNLGQIEKFLQVINQ